MSSGSEKTRGFDLEDKIKPTVKIKVTVEQVQLLERQPESSSQCLLNAMKFSFKLTLKIALVAGVIYAGYAMNLHGLAYNYAQTNLDPDAKALLAKLENPEALLKSLREHSEATGSTVSGVSLASAPTLRPKLPEVLGEIIYNPKVFPELAKEELATLELNSLPAANVIVLNNKKIVDTSQQNIHAPISELKLAPGEYDLTLENTSLGVFRTKHISITPKQFLKLDFTLTDQ